MSFSIDVGVMINDLITSGEGGRVLIKELRDSYVGRACNDCNGSTICIYHEQKLQPDSDVLRIHILYVVDTFSTRHEGSHASMMAVTEDTDKYRLVKIPPSSREPPDVGLNRIRKASRDRHVLFVAQNGVVLGLAESQLAKTATLASLQTNGLKGAATTKAISFCA